MVLFMHMSINVLKCFTLRCAIAEEIMISLNFESILDDAVNHCLDPIESDILF